MKLVRVNKTDATETQKVEKALDIALKGYKLLKQARKAFQGIDDDKLLDEENWGKGTSEQYIDAIDEALENLDLL